MEPTYEPPSTRALLHNAAWVLRLARHLIADEHLAQDVAQEAMAAAIERPPAFVDDTGRLRRWLAGVTRRLAALAVTRERGRAVAEGGAARREADSGDANAAERLRLHRRLTEAVLALEAPYRSALVMRYFDDLAPREIAERLGIAPATARKRLSRGLEQLRGRLDREYGGERRTWCLALGGLLRAADDAPPAALHWGALHKAPALAGAALIGVLALGIFLQLTGAPVTPLVPDRLASNPQSPIPLLVPYRLPVMKTPPALARATRNAAAASALILASGATASSQSLLYTFDGDSPEDEFGYSVSGAGDVDRRLS